jgi:probable HAF family extracellular repeat protein
VVHAPEGISGDGQVVGYAAIAGDADYHAFLYDATATPPMQDLNLFCFC